MGFAVITRGEDAGSGYALAFAQHGLAVVRMPVTRVVPAEDPDALARSLRTTTYAAIVCASPRAAEAVVRALAANADPAVVRRPIPELWAVGPATARILIDAGLAPLIPDASRDGATLAHAVVAARTLAGRRVLVPRAAGGREEAIAIVRAAGAVVDDVIAYRTVPVAADDPAIQRGRELLVSGRAEVCAVFAPSQVAALDALLGVGQLATRFVAIGETTAAALRAAGARALAVAATPTPEGIANAVAAVYPRER
jgi:uroporphyrinogen-III synthase